MFLLSFFFFLPLIVLRVGVAEFWKYIQRDEYEEKNILPASLPFQI